jgi:hypothetical protein
MKWYGNPSGGPGRKLHNVCSAHLTLHGQDVTEVLHTITAGDVRLQLQLLTSPSAQGVGRVHCDVGSCNKVLRHFHHIADVIEVFIYL